MSDMRIKEAIKERSSHSWWKTSEKEVVEKYGNLFKPSVLRKLTKEEFKSFLLIKNNLHWEGIHRQGNLITSNMEKLKEYLELLLNEKIPIRERLTRLFGKNSRLRIKGFGRAVITPILLVVYPAKYGVWNARSEKALSKLKLLPKFKSSDDFSEKYLKVNQVLLDLAKRHKISLWQLDMVLGEISGSPSKKSESVEDRLNETASEVGVEDFPDFAMETHLEEFLVANWDKTVFARKYELIYEEGDLVSRQYETKVGDIDILAQSKDKNSLLVIELKKGRSSDAVVGQISRYMNWVKESMAKNMSVEGAVVVLDYDDKLIYSLKSFNNIRLYRYKVNFQLIAENK